MLRRGRDQECSKLFQRNCEECLAGSTEHVLASGTCKSAALYDFKLTILYPGYGGNTGNTVFVSTC